MELLNKRKKEQIGVVLFSDEKRFMYRIINRYSDDYIKFSDKKSLLDNVKFTCKPKYPMALMVLGVIAPDGKVCPPPPIFIPEGLRVMAAVGQHLKKDALPWIQETYGDQQVTFQQDEAPPYMTRSTQKLLANTVNFWTSVCHLPLI